MHITFATFSIAAFAASASAAAGTPLDIVPLTVPDGQNSITFNASTDSSSFSTLRGSIGPSVTWPVVIENTAGFDFGRVVVRIEPDDNETYAPGEFESIFFAAPSTGDVQDSPLPGDTDAPFTVTEASLSDDGGLLAPSQRLDFVFDGAAPHAVGDALLYEFTIENPNEVLYTYSLEFFPVPAPGSAALALGALGLCVTRRRG